MLICDVYIPIMLLCVAFIVKRVCHAAHGDGGQLIQIDQLGEQPGLLCAVIFRHSDAGGTHGTVGSIVAVRVAVFLAGKFEACSVLQCNGNGTVCFRNAPIASVAAFKPEGDRRDRRRLPAVVLILVGRLVQLDTSSCSS